MKIELTRKEYRDLLDVFALATWVLNAHKVKDDSRTEPYNKLEQKFFALAKEMNYENLVEYAPEHSCYFPTKEYEETSQFFPFIDEYDNDTFWDELVSRLAERDLANQLGGYEKITALTREEMFKRLGLLEEYYGDEFNRNGLKNLYLRNKRLSGRRSKLVN